MRRILRAIAVTLAVAWTVAITLLGILGGPGVSG